MNPTHHPSDTLLLGYAAGTTSEADALAMSTHLTFCPECRARLATAETVGGALLEQMDSASLSPAVLQSVLARLDEPAPIAAKHPPRVDAIGGLPRALADYAMRAMAQSGWRMVAPGIRQLALSTAGDAKARILELKPGTVLPEHGHRGTELTILLAGSYTDELGRFARGDMAELDESVVHRPIVDDGPDCIALIVTEAPLKFRGWMARLAQPLIGI
jgi:putative transcriptional regulator